MHDLPLEAKKPLGEILKEAGLINDVLLGAALDYQREHGGKLGQILVEVGFVDEEAVAVALARQLHLQPVRLDQLNVRPEVLRSLRREQVERFNVFPVSLSRRHKHLQVATADPTDVETKVALGFYTGMRVSFLVSGWEALGRAIDRHYRAEAAAKQPGMKLSIELPEGMALPVDPGVSQKVDEMAGKILQLERRLQEQSFAMRGMLDILDRKGVVARSELRQRLRPFPSRPPPLPLPAAARTSALAVRSRRA